MSRNDQKPAEAPGDTTASGTNVALQQLEREFFELLNDAAGCAVYARLALPLFLEVPPVREMLSSAIPGARLLIGDSMPHLPEATFHQAWGVESLPERLAPGGLVDISIGRQWLITIYAYWEDNYRAKFAKTLGLENADELTDDRFGDLRLMRHDLVHRGGVASKRYAASCKIFQWFNEGDIIHLTGQHIKLFTESIGMLGKP